MTITRFSTGAIRDNALATNVSFAASDMELIGTVRVGSGGVASVTFSNIPQEYKHLQIRWIGRANATVLGVNLTLNSDTGTNYSRHQLEGDGATASSGAATSTAPTYLGYCASSGYGANIFGAAIFDVLDYTNTAKYKTVRCLTGVDNNGSGVVGLISQLWRNTNAITSVSLAPQSSNSFVQHSRISLYGIRG